MKNQQLEHELERIGNCDEVKINTTHYSGENDENYWLDVNDSGYIYYNLNDLVQDCIELSKRFKLEFV